MTILEADGKEIIKVRDLKKIFKVPFKENDGLLASLKQLINRKYVMVEAINGIDLCVKKGEIMALIGPNGSGKSTTIKVLTGALFPSEGYVNVSGYVPWINRKDYVKKIGVVTGQRSQLIWDLPPIDTFAFNKVVYKIEKIRYSYVLSEFTEILNLHDIIKRPVRQLSLGERMKCEVVCALLHEPEIVYLDEPTIGLDLNAKISIHNFIKKVNKDKKTTFILTTHNLDDVEALCENIAIISKGIIVYYDSLENLKKMVSNKRVINITFSGKADKEVLKDYEMIMLSESNIKIKVDLSNKSIQDIIYNILKILPCTDITIESVKIEDIISQIYRW